MTGVPFFISGAGRSDSTYLYHLLRSHPKIALTNEARIIDALWRSYQSVALPYGEAESVARSCGALMSQLGLAEGAGMERDRR